MKSSKKFVVFIFLITFICNIPAFSYFVNYKEEYYSLFHTHYQQYPADVIENIYWLEKASQAPFCNPKFAFAKIEDKTQWEKYRYLFNMHINLKLIEQHLRLGAIYDKGKGYFFEEPWKDIYIEELGKAEQCYKTALCYWKDAKAYAEKANDVKFQFINLKEITNWQDEQFRIVNNKLDYEKIINRELTRVEQIIAKFEEMDENTY